MIFYILYHCVGREVLDGLSRLDSCPDIGRGNIQKGGLAKVNGTSLRTDKSMACFVKLITGENVLRQDGSQTLVFITWSGHHHEMAQTQKRLPVAPGGNRIKGVLSGDEKQL